MNKNSEHQKRFTCKVVFPKGYPYHKRKAFVKDAMKLAHYDGNKPKDKEIHLIFDNPLQRQLMHVIATSKGFQVINTN